MAELMLTATGEVPVWLVCGEAPPGSPSGAVSPVLPCGTPGSAAGRSPSQSAIESRRSLASLPPLPPKDPLVPIRFTCLERSLWNAGHCPSLSLGPM